MLNGARLIQVLLGLLASGAVVAGFLALERRNRAIGTTLVVWAVVLVDTALYPDSRSITLQSAFRVSFSGVTVRLVQVLIVLALVARVLARGWPRRIDLAALWWLLFFGWMLVAAAVGLMSGHGVSLVVRQASAVLFVGGSLALAASTPARQWVEGLALARFVQAAAVVGALLFVLDQVGVSVTGEPLPWLPLLGFGSFGADASTMFASVGVLGAVVECARPTRRMSVLVPALLLVLTHLASSQRAARLGLAVSLLVLVVALVLTAGRTRLRVSPAELVLAAMAFLGVLTVPVFVQSAQTASDGSPPSVRIPFTEETLRALDTDRRRGSIESRYNQWHVARDLIVDKPLTGHGLGQTVVYYEVGVAGFVERDITHNMALDVLLRMGFAGFVLALLAAALSLRQGFVAWRRHPDPVVGALALGAVVLVCGLLAKGMVESLFEKDRLAVLIGLLLGVLSSVWYDGRREEDDAVAAPASAAAAQA